MEDLIIYGVGALAVRGARHVFFGPSREARLAEQVQQLSSQVAEQAQMIQQLQTQALAPNAEHQGTLSGQQDELPRRGAERSNDVLLAPRKSGPRSGKRSARSVCGVMRPTKRLRHAAHAEALAAEPVSSVDESDSSEDDSEAPGGESRGVRSLSTLSAGQGEASSPSEEDSREESEEESLNEHEQPREVFYSSPDPSNSNPEESSPESDSSREDKSSEDDSCEDDRVPLRAVAHDSTSNASSSKSDEASTSESEDNNPAQSDLPRTQSTQRLRGSEAERSVSSELDRDQPDVSRRSSDISKSSPESSSSEDSEDSGSSVRSEEAASDGAPEEAPILHEATTIEEPYSGMQACYGAEAQQEEPAVGSHDIGTASMGPLEDGMTPIEEHDNPLQQGSLPRGELSAEEVQGAEPVTATVTQEISLEQSSSRLSNPVHSQDANEPHEEEPVSSAEQQHDDSFGMAPSQHIAGVPQVSETDIKDGASDSQETGSAAKRSRDSSEDGCGLPEPKRSCSVFHRCTHALSGWLFGSPLGTATSASEAHAVHAPDTPGEQDLPAETSIADEFPHTNQPHGSAAVHAGPHAEDDAEGQGTAAAEPALETAVSEAPTAYPTAAAAAETLHAPQPLATGVFADEELSMDDAFLTELNQIFHDDERLRSASPPESPVQADAIRAEGPALHNDDPEVLRRMQTLEVVGNNDSLHSMPESSRSAADDDLPARATNTPLTTGTAGAAGQQSPSASPDSPAQAAGNAEEQECDDASDGHLERSPSPERHASTTQGSGLHGLRHESLNGRSLSPIRASIPSWQHLPAPGLSYSALRSLSRSPCRYGYGPGSPCRSASIPESLPRLGCAAPSIDYMAPGISHSPPRIGHSPTSPSYAPTSPVYSPSLPAESPTSPAYSPRAPAYSPTSPVYPPKSPARSPPNLEYEPWEVRYFPSSPRLPAYSPTSPAYEPTSPLMYDYEALGHKCSPTYRPASIQRPGRAAEQSPSLANSSLPYDNRHGGMQSRSPSPSPRWHSPSPERRGTRSRGHTLSASRSCSPKVLGQFPGPDSRRRHRCRGDSRSASPRHLMNHGHSRSASPRECSHTPGSSDRHRCPYTLRAWTPSYLMRHSRSRSANPAHRSPTSDNSEGHRSRSIPSADERAPTPDSSGGSWRVRRRSPSPRHYPRSPLRGRQPHQGGSPLGRSLSIHRQQSSSDGDGNRYMSPYSTPSEQAGNPGGRSQSPRALVCLQDCPFCRTISPDVPDLDDEYARESTRMRNRDSWRACRSRGSRSSSLSSQARSPSRSARDKDLSPTPDGTPSHRRAERSPSPAHEYRSPARRSAFGYSSLLSHSSTPRIRSPSPARSVSRSPHQQDRHKCHSIGPEWGPLGSSAYQSRSSTSRSPSPHMRASGSLGRQGRQGSLSYGPEWNPSPYRAWVPAPGWVHSGPPVVSTRVPPRTPRRQLSMAPYAAKQIQKSPTPAARPGLSADFWRDVHVVEPASSGSPTASPSPQRLAFPTDAQPHEALGLEDGSTSAAADDQPSDDARTPPGPSLAAESPQQGSDASPAGNPAPAAGSQPGGRSQSPEQMLGGRRRLAFRMQRSQHPIRLGTLAGPSPHPGIVPGRMQHLWPRAAQRPDNSSNANNDSAEADEAPGQIAGAAGGPAWERLHARSRRAGCQSHLSHSGGSPDLRPGGAWAERNAARSHGSRRRRNSHSKASGGRDSQGLQPGEAKAERSAARNHDLGSNSHSPRVSQARHASDSHHSRNSENCDSRGLRLGEAQAEPSAARSHHSHSCGGRRQSASHGGRHSQQVSSHSGSHGRSGSQRSHRRRPLLQRMRAMLRPRRRLFGAWRAGAHGGRNRGRRSGASPAANTSGTAGVTAAKGFEDALESTRAANALQEALDPMGARDISPQLEAPPGRARGVLLPRSPSPCTKAEAQMGGSRELQQDADLHIARQRACEELDNLRRGIFRQPDTGRSSNFQGARGSCSSQERLPQACYTFGEEDITDLTLSDCN